MKTEIYFYYYIFPFFLVLYSLALLGTNVLTKNFGIQKMQWSQQNEP